MFPHWEQVFRDSIAPITPEFFRGKVGLDGGCGFGRSLFYAATYGAEMIGLDLSEAIEAARENTRSPSQRAPRAGRHLSPARAAQSLDFVYSIGVLHHLPDPKGGFLSLTRLLKPGAPMFIWVYLRGRGRQIVVFNVDARDLDPLPLRLLNAVCFLLAAAQWTGWLLPYRGLRRFRLTRPLARADAVHGLRDVSVPRAAYRLVRRPVGAARELLQARRDRRLVPRRRDRNACASKTNVTGTAAPWATRPVSKDAGRRPSVMMVTGAYYPETSGAGLQCRALIRACGDAAHVFRPDDRARPGAAGRR